MNLLAVREGFLNVDPTAAPMVERIEAGMALLPSSNIVALRALMLKPKKVDLMPLVPNQSVPSTLIVSVSRLTSRGSLH